MGAKHNPETMVARIAVLKFLPLRVAISVNMTSATRVTSCASIMSTTVCSPGHQIRAEDPVRNAIRSRTLNPKPAEDPVRNAI